VKPILPFVVMACLTAGSAFAAPAPAAVWHDAVTAARFWAAGARMTACQPAAELLDNLRVLAEARLPVPATQITYTTLPAPEASFFAAQAGAAPEPGAIRQQERLGARWVFTVHRETVSLDVHPPGSRRDAWLSYSFPRGGLGASPGLAQAADQLKASLARLQVSAARVEIASPVHPGYLSAGGAMWDPASLRSLLNIDSAHAWVRDCSSWSEEMVDTYRGGRITRDSATVLNMGNGTRVGFAPGRAVWVGTKSGVTTITWYSLPGIRMP
jgi:hypothetical protein